MKVTSQARVLDILRSYLGRVLTTLEFFLSLFSVYADARIVLRLYHYRFLSKSSSVMLFSDANWSDAQSIIKWLTKRWNCHKPGASDKFVFSHKDIKRPCGYPAIFMYSECDVLMFVSKQTGLLEGKQICWHFFVLHLSFSISFSSSDIATLGIRSVTVGFFALYCRIE